MRRLRFCRPAFFLGIAAFALAGVQAFAQTPTAQADDNIRYEVSPILQNGELKSLRITLRFTGERDGQTTVFLPNEYAGQIELWRQLSSPRISGGTITQPRAHQWVVQHNSHARIAITYDLTSAFDSDPTVGTITSKVFSPIIRPTWFSLVGSTSFARLNVDDKTPVRFAWRDVPRGWQVASDLDHRGLTADDVTASSLIGGKDLRVLRLGRGSTRIAMQGGFVGFSAANLQADFSELSTTLSDLWRDTDRPFFVSLAPLVDDIGGAFQLGTGLGDDAFAAWALETTSRGNLLWLLAHEHLHAWLPGQVGGLDGSKSEISSYWFSEGFTNYYTARTLLRSGLWTPEDWVKHWNEMIGEFQASPARLMPAVDTVDTFWTDRTVGELPYQRGALIALTIDQRIKEATNHTKNLDDVMLLMRDKARNSGKFAPALLIESVKEVAGLDVTSLINDVAINGQAIGLPSQAWGGCISLQESVRPVFDVGFDRTRTGMADNVVSGVVSNGPAFKAGLRDGMKIMRRTTGELGNPNTAVTYEVEVSAGKVETLSWLPRSEPINTQMLSLGADLTIDASADRRTHCLSSLSGE